MTLTELSRGFSVYQASNNTPYSPPPGPDSKIKSLPEEKSDDELPVGSVNYSSLPSMVIYVDFQMGDVSGGNGYMNIYLISQ